jgi:hypothetical protein
MAAASATAASTTVAAPTTRTTSSAFALRTRFVHNQGPTEKFLPVQCRNGLFCFRVILDLRKAKPARLAGEAIAKKGERIGLHTSFGKQRLDFLFSSLKR